MKFKKLLIMTLIMGMALITPTTAKAAEETGEILYEYDAATAAQDWKFYERGHWTFDENGISCDNDGRTGDDAWYYTYIGNEEGWTDYVIEADFVNVSEGGIIFRSANPTDETVDAFDGYYIGTDSSYLFAGKDTNNEWDTIEQAGPDASASFQMGYQANMHWKIVVQGDIYTLYLDDAKFPTLQVCDDTYKTGGVAVRFRVYSGDLSGHVQNLKVTKLEATEQEEVSNADSKQEEKEQNKIEKGNSSTGLYIGAAVAAIVVVVLVIVLIKVSKKR